ncbi:ribonuclease HII [Aciduricibacillus chroicocephali]|uniref:Ribonuclease HII n=1 Tax=Aciduricibacillus chroicocephali TaxID=3054939 RepID=A0ABY9KYM9_9BACI|nr:ribonuclease HII [Bacillaceae bacterium 44XB]
MEKKSISEIKTLLEEKPPSAAFLAQLKEDPRKGVQQILTKLQKKQEKETELRNQFIQMCLFENRQRERGYRFIAGIDEAGRGPLAGPVTAAAVILPEGFFLPGLNDSKKLTEKQRDHYAAVIKEEAVSWHVSVIEAGEIDRINIFEATKKAMLTAIERLQPEPEFCLIDAVRLTYLRCPSESIEKGDARSVSIAAASILAKTERDRIMLALHEIYPQYRFDSNKGYGTKDHLEGLAKFGPSPCHRQSFSPVAQATTIHQKG